MNAKLPSRKYTRRDFLKLGGGLVAATAGVSLLPRAVAAAANANLLPKSVAQLLHPVPPADTTTGPHYHLAATDGFVFMPGSVEFPGSGGTQFFIPDPLAPAPLTSWGFGFRNVTGLTQGQIEDQRNKFQTSAPLLWADEEDNFRITLTNLGMAIRPDLTDGHTIHFHGFRNAMPIFDGVPEMSVGVPIARDFTYYYKPHDPGTYMYHCHFEDVEHVSMGMAGIVFIRPKQNKTPLNPGEKYVYNDGDGSTRYDREFGMFLNEWWAEAHFRGAHIQEHDWSEYEPDYWLLNGRCYPDTLAPNGAWINPGNPAGTDASGDLIATAGYEHLKYQPISSLVTANEHEKVLLRFANLGYQQHAMKLDGISMKIVGRDATFLRGRDGTDLSYMTDTIEIGPGESYDAIFEAPGYIGPGTYDTYLLYNRNYTYLHNPGVSGLGGQMTEVRVYPSGTLGAQTVPNA